MQYLSTTLLVITDTGFYAIIDKTAIKTKFALQREILVSQEMA